MIMNATIIDISPQVLTVRNQANHEEVIVRYRNTRRFVVGDRIRITYSGIMTMSFPPQITANNIQLIASPPIIAPREMRAQVLRRESNFLIVRNNLNGQILRVDSGDARFFCPGRQVVIRHTGVIPGIPPRVNALELTPIC
ncbi:MAG: YobA family protein [Oscillospiraceae bacterium]|nr:YobA family protein [Oscillospiraceae bacterium]